jgi:putative DNA methylase
MPKRLNILPTRSSPLIIYDNIGYADLSDFFFCWMKPVVRPVFDDIFGVLATPKAEELVATPYRHGGKEAAKPFSSTV